MTVGWFVVVMVYPVRLASMTLESVLWIMAFLIGIALFANAVDRQVIGLVRTLIPVSVVGPEPDESPA